MNRIDESNTLDGINNNTYNTFFKKEEYVSRLIKNDREFLITAIQNFTKLNDEDIYLLLKRQNTIKKNGIGFIAERNLKKFNFYFLDMFLEKEKEELRSDERLGKCINMSINLAYSYADKCKVAIGYLDNSNSKIMHAIFIECDGDKDYVFDYTMNIVMEKEEFIELTDFKIINEVDGEDIKKDSYILSKIEYFHPKFYLCFRNEIINDLKRNNKILKLED